MTDPEFADATYIEPIQPEYLEQVIAAERPDALLATLGGQTALNTAVALHEIGRAGQVRRGADRRLHRGDPARARTGRSSRRSSPRSTFPACTPEVARSAICHTMDEVLAAADRPRLPAWSSGPSFTMGGVGSGFAHDEDELRRIAGSGLAASPVTEVLIEESMLGWKEYELEVMRDTRRQRRHRLLDREPRPDGRAHRRLDHRRPRDDPDRPRVPGDARRGHRGDPRGRRRHRRLQHPVRDQPRQRPDDRDRDEPAGVAVARRWRPRRPASRSPRSRPRSRSATPSTRSPTTSPPRPRPPSSRRLDYVVVKAPRFAFEKFPTADSTLTTHMKSVGEAMAIGRNFTEALGKALRSLEDAKAPFDFTSPIDRAAGRAAGQHAPVRTTAGSTSSCTPSGSAPTPRSCSRPPRSTRGSSTSCS